MVAGAGSRKPNIRQVAARAGVSHMTVSRVLNDYPNIRPETRARVLEVIEELNYRPNLAARALATQRFRRIGVMVESAAEFGPASTIRAVEVAARAAGYSVTSTALREPPMMSPQDAVDLLTDQGIDGLCVVAPRSASVAALRRIAIDVPVLVVKSDDDPTFLTVSADQRLGAHLAVDHLAELGHRDILHVAGPLDWLDARARERAFHDRIGARGLRRRPIVVGDWSADFGYDFAAGTTRWPDCRFRGQRRHGHRPRARTDRTRICRAGRHQRGRLRRRALGPTRAATADHRTTGLRGPRSAGG